MEAVNAANRKATLTKYIVTVRRSYEVNTQMEVEARSVEEAEGLVDAILDADPAKLQPFLQQFAASTKAKKKR